MPKLRISLSDDNEILQELTEDSLTIGRLADNGLQIEDGSVSSHHAEIVNEGGSYKLRDLGSTNGTFVNGAQIEEAVLKASDRVRFGNIDCVLEGDGAVADAGSKPLPQSERVTASIGSSSARPANFVNASPFPKPAPKKDGLTVAAIAIAAIGALAFLAAMAMTFTLSAPAA